MNHYGEKSVLQCVVDKAYGKSRLKSNFFTSPLKIARPLLSDNEEVLKLCVLNSSPGLLSGDEYLIEFDVKEDAQVEVTAQSYTLIHPTEDGQAIQETRLSVADRGLLIYFPLPTIPYKDSTFISKTQIDLTDEARLIYVDILSCGRYHHDERFRYKRYKSTTTIKQDGEMVYKDITHINPDHDDIDAIGYYEGYGHQSTVIFKGFEISDIREIMVEALKDQSMIYGLSTLENPQYNVARVLCNSSERIREKINGIIRQLQDVNIK